jgi:hypothetical protein
MLDVRHTIREASRQLGTKAYRQTDKETDTETDRFKDMQTINRQTGRCQFFFT